MGDKLFEISRARAQAEHDALAEAAKKQRRSEQWIEQLIELKTGSAVASVSLEKMSDEWISTEVGRAPRYISAVKLMHTQFVAFLATNYKRVKSMADVDKRMAKQFMEVVKARGYAGATYNKKLNAMQTTFNVLAKDAGVVENPFEALKDESEDTINRRPFPADELERILTVAQSPQHALIYPMVVVASMTAMREADCCQLQKSAINRLEGTIRVKTAKTGKTVTIPIAPKLAEVLAAAPVTNSPYVFPECAQLFKLHPDAITDRTRAVLADAGYFDPVPGGPKPIAPIHVEREPGKGIRRASVIDFHSFRATWVTIAMTHGVPIDVVCLVTGHGSVETLRKHYFLPGLEDLRRVLNTRLPTVLGGEKNTPVSDADMMRSLAVKLALMKDENWAKIRDELAATVATSIQLGSAKP